jgi:hypothetical protein
MRESVFGHLLVEPAQAGPTPPLEAAALRLRSQLALSGTEALEPVESALLDRWLQRIGGG